MKLVTYKLNDSSNPRLGAVINDFILDLNESSNGVLPDSMLDFISGGDKNLNIANELIEKYKSKLSLKTSAVKILAPLLNPPSLRDFFAFEDHAKAGAARRGVTLPEAWYEIPAYYKGNHRQIFGSEDEIPWPSYTRKLDFECEIACVIGKKGINISVENADDYIFGYMIFNDVSARDIQKKEMSVWMGPAKSKDFANVFGPYLVTKDEVDPKKDFLLKIKVNGEEWSSGHFNLQYWGFPVMISHVSQEESVYPGDILGSGTFHKGCGLDLDRWIKSGDIIELEVNKLGLLRNKVGVPVLQKELNYKKEGIKLN